MPGDNFQGREKRELVKERAQEASMKMEVAERKVWFLCVRRGAEWWPAFGIHCWNQDKISPHMSSCQPDKRCPGSVWDEYFPARKATGCGGALLISAQRGHSNTLPAEVRCVHGGRRPDRVTVCPWGQSNTAVSVHTFALPRSRGNKGAKRSST